MFKLLAALSCGAISAHLYTENNEMQLELFEKFKSTYNLQYESEEENKYRLSVFLSNLKTADHLNTLGGATFGVTEHMGMTEDEFVKSFLGFDESAATPKLRNPPKKTPAIHMYAPDNSTEVKLGATYNKDWTTGTVRTTPVKSLGGLGCGGTWAFAALEQLESDNIRSVMTNIIVLV